MDFLPSVVEAEYRGGFCIHLVFNDGIEATVDFTHWLEGPVFEPLKDAAYFRRFFLDGGTVAWPNGADIAPETLYAESKAASAAQPLKARIGIQFSVPQELSVLSRCQEMASSDLRNHLYGLHRSLRLQR